MNHRKGKERAGMGLIALILLVTSVFVLMTAGAGDLLNTSLHQASRAQSNRRTSYCSYAIMQRALDKLSSNVPSSLLYSVDPAESGTWSEDPELIYTLTIYNNYNGTFSNPAPDGRFVPPYMVYIKVKSDYRDYPGRYTSTLFSKAYVGGQASNFAVVGTEKVTIENSVVDAWYVKKTGAGHTLTKSSVGRVVTNSVRPNYLNIGGTSNVDANVFWGPYGAPTVLNVTLPAVINAARTQQAAPSPTRVPRFHPPMNPGVGAQPPQTFTTTPGGPLTPGNYKSLTVVGPGTTLNLTSGEYYFADNITITNATLAIPGVTGAAPCDIYVGKSFTAVNSKINWANTLKTIAPDPPADLSLQATLGPRTLRLFYVGSGAPNFKDCQLTATNSTMSLHAAGKAMKVDLLDGTILWGGLKGFEINLKNSELHYHRVAADT